MDTIVVAKDVAEDLKSMLSELKHPEIKTVPGTHDFPIPSCNKVVKYIEAFWNLKIIT